MRKLVKKKAAIPKVRVTAPISPSVARRARARQEKMKQADPNFTMSLLIEFLLRRWVQGRIYKVPNEIFP